MIRAALALLPFTIAFSAAAAPDLGVKPNEQLHISIVRTASRSMNAEPLATLCLVGLRKKYDDNTLPQRKDEFPICESFGGPGVMVKEFATADFDASEWDESGDSFGELPLQKTLDGTISGEELNDAYGKLRSLCREEVCRDYRLIVLYWSLHENSSGGRGFKLPIPELIPLKAFSIFPLGDGATKDFAVWNLQLRVTGKR